jgi:hypothetical protein
MTALALDRKTSDRDSCKRHSAQVCIALRANMSEIEQAGYEERDWKNIKEFLEQNGIEHLYACPRYANS